MIYFAFVVSVLVVLYTMYKFFFSRLSIQWEKTLWLERIIGIEIWFYDKSHRVGTNYGFTWGKEKDNEFELSHTRK